MQKIISLYQRNYDGDHLVRDEIVPGAEWVLEGEGRPTRKLDGTCCLIRDGKLFKRYEVRKGKTAPSDFVPASEVDATTGKQQGWRPVGDGPEDRYHREAFDQSLDDGSYELVGPKVQGNPEGYDKHQLVPHGSISVDWAPCGFDAMRHWFTSHNVEGIVWHHPDGRMVKLKGKDFGVRRLKDARPPDSSP